MRIKKLMAIVFVLSMTFVFAACGSNQNTEDENEAIDFTDKESTKEYTKMYESILDPLYEQIANGFGEEIEEWTIGIAEIVGFSEDTDEALSKVGYVIEDISGDGIPELLIISTDDVADGKAYGRIVLAAFTIIDDEPTEVFHGWARSAYIWMGDGEFHYNGSGGAIYSIVAHYSIAEDGSELICEDYYFTHERNGDFEDVAVYHSQVDDAEVDEAEETDMSLDDLWSIDEGYRDKEQSFEITLFNDYK